MTDTRLNRKEATGSLYVFFQSADYPLSPSYITFDTDAMAWGDPVTLPAMLLHDKEDIFYNSSPRAIYWNSQIYIFGRGPDNHVAVMTMTLDGATSDPVTLNDQTCTAVTPYIWNNNLYIFYAGVGSSNPLCCTQYDANLKMVTYWVASNSQSTDPVSFVPTDSNGGGVVVYNSGSNLYQVNFSMSTGFSSNSATLPIKINFGTSYITIPGDPGADADMGGDYVLFRDIASSYVSCFGIMDDNPNHNSSVFQIEGISADADLSAVLFYGDGKSADIAIFYVDDLQLKVSGIHVTPNYNDNNNIFWADFNIKIIQPTGVAMPDVNCSPCALVIS
ncbi:hypothetical protein PHO31112_04414 [Pandoraea horticolens]|uniref:Uncharacterized protein n=1 Tax=Pandoraea horticolens TaxID=2508298 RepID=A0A5E4YD56_9BURK|nr:hypothetical protein [Pandoraea horticolens]VVE46093.1 hypothetical protein PHO31112_04414 [Pandoraea horticolens]